VDRLSELLAGRLSDPDTGGRLSVPVKSVVIAPSLAGAEADLVKSIGLEAPFAVVSDDNTHAALGRRIEAALTTIGKVIPVRLGDRPHADEITAARVLAEGSEARSFVAVGSGTINDLAKYSAARQGKSCAVFATAPSMNGYSSVNAAITVNGHKQSLAAAAPQGIFVDLEVMVRAPKRLIRSGFGDAICRSTAQADWLLAHHLFASPYCSAPFMLFADLEEEMVASAPRLMEDDPGAIECLTRVLILSGFGMTIAGSSRPASQGEHLISHHLEMMPPAGWEGAFHGEQIAVTTLVMARLQEVILACEEAPRLRPTPIRQGELIRHFGDDVGCACWREFEPKVIDADRAAALNAQLAETWPAFRKEVLGRMRPARDIAAALAAAGAPMNHADIGLPRQVLADAIRYARTIRNRYTFLDLADDSGLLDVEKVLR
jgi:glycerol-1-phosphate dehydrogenase [NAD(P)+]